MWNICTLTEGMIDLSSINKIIRVFLKFTIRHITYPVTYLMSRNAPMSHSVTRMSQTRDSRDSDGDQDRPVRDQCGECGMIRVPPDRSGMPPRKN